MVELYFKNETEQIWFMMNLNRIGPRNGIKFGILRGDTIEKFCYDGDTNTVVNNPEDYLRISQRIYDLVRTEE